MALRSEQVGFQFRERMTGPVSAGTEDPQLGAARGRAAGTVLTLDLQVTVSDLGACFHDPQHVARLEGTVTLPELATAQPVRDGQLLLYVRDPASRTKLMRYRLGFRSDRGAEFFLDGAKVLHTPWASPREQVTLYTRVHEHDIGGPIWGAGILAFHLRDLPAFLLSMRAVGASRLQGLRMFLGFAGRELTTPA
jgi:hypothetical protein